MSIPISVIQAGQDGQALAKVAQVDSHDSTGYYSPMSKAEILQELPRLTAADRLEIRQKLNEIDGDAWLDGDDPLTDDEKALLEVRLAAYEKEPDAGSSWEEVETRIQSRING